jgi:membrane protease YdiL (CAAX protease family)
MPVSSRKTTVDIITFLVLVVAISSIFWFLVIHASSGGGGRGGGRSLTMGLMWSPAAAAILTVWIRKLDISSLGWGWGDNRWNLTAYLLPLGYAFVAYLIIWVLGFGTFGDAATVEKLGASMGWKAGYWVSLIGYVVLTATVVMLQALSSALGEEIGWRGFLAPRVVAKTGFTAGVIIVGLIWTLWHFPLILLGNYNQGTPMYVTLPCFTVLVVGVCTISTWLRLKSGSVWPSAILHGSHNLFIQAVFTPLTGEKGKITAYAVGEFGFFVPAVIAIVAIYFWTRRGEVEGQIAAPQGLPRKAVPA